MQTGKLCNRKPITVRRNDELVKAAQLMREKHIGYLVVVDSEDGNPTMQPVGVVTDRDIVTSVIARQVDPRTLRVGDVMTQHPVTIGVAESVAKALREMRRIGVRRLPVVGKRGELIGVLSLDEVLEALAGELQSVAGSIRKELLVEESLRP